MLTLKSSQATEVQPRRSYVTCALLVMACVGHLLSCNSAGTTRVNVHLIGTTPDTDTVKVTFSLDSVPDARSPFTFQKDTTYFGIDFPAPGSSGLASIAVETYTQTCLTGSGQTQLSISSGHTYEVDINFAAMTKSCPVTIKKSGEGTVTDGQGKITCGQTCTAFYPVGSSVALTALPAISGSPFQWGGACSGGGTCNVTIQSAASVSVDFTPRVCLQSGFCWEYPRPQGVDLRAAWVAPDGTLYAVGQQGTVLRGNGVMWSSINVGTTSYLNGIWGSNANDIWIVGVGGTMLHYDGSGWKSVTSGTTQNLRGIWGSSGNDIWAVGDATIIHYDGSQWKPSTFAGGQLTSVWGSAPSDVWAVGMNNTIFHNTGGGWSAVPSGATSGDFLSVWGTGAGDVWASGTNVVRWNGTAWAITENPVLHQKGDILSSIWGSGANTVWTAGGGGRIYRWDGSAWSLATTLGVTNYTAITGSQSTAWIVGQGGAISNLAGGQWQLVSSPSEVDFSSVWMNSNSDGWAVGQGGILYHTQDGLTWKATSPSPTTATLRSVWGTGTDNVWAVGDSGTVLRYNGQSWMMLAPSGGTDISTHVLGSISGTGPNDIWIAGYQTTGGGTTFLHWDGSKLVAMPTPPDASSIAVFKGTPFAAVGSSPGIYQFSSGAWSKVSDLSAYRLAVQGDTLVAAGSSGLSRYDGSAWKTDLTGMFYGVYAAGPSNAWAWGGLGSNRLVRWDGSKWADFDMFPQSIYDIGGSGASDVWAVGARGSILHLHQ